MSTIGVYVHFPWCLKKCPYCDFVSFARERSAIDDAGYADAVVAEIERRAHVFEGRRIESVFFGGGTPSLWDARQIGRVLSRLAAVAERSADLEVTVECNPTSLDEERARRLVGAGVNRLSVGVQGLDAERLRFLGRLHDPEGGLEAVRAAVRAGVPRVSADLIFGVAGRGEIDAEGAGATQARREQSPEEAAAEALCVASLGVTHLSAYGLTIEPGTPFGALARKGRLPIASDDALADSFLAVEEALASVGLEHYEVSSYARPGHEARHNLGYWRGRDYVGLGCAAFGTVTGLGESAGRPGYALRYRNPADPDRYVRAVFDAREGERIEDVRELLDPETRLRERVMLGLRLAEGLDLEAAASELGVEAWTPARWRAADRLATAGRLVVDGGRLRVPRSAWLLSDGTAAELF